MTILANKVKELRSQLYNILYKKEVQKQKNLVRAYIHLRGLSSDIHKNEILAKYYNVHKLSKRQIVQKVIDQVDAKYSNSNLRSISPLKRISQGFGIGMCELDDFNKNLLWTTGKIRIRDTKKIWKKITVPTYIKRKLFYALSNNFDGTKSWVLTYKGKLWLKSIYNHQANTLAKKLSACQLSDNNKAIVNSLMRGRCYRMLADYILVYKDKCIASPDVLPSPYEMVELRSSRHLLGNIVSLDTIRKNHGYYAVKSIINDIHREYQINEFNNPQFKDFDKIVDIYDNYYKDLNQRQQESLLLQQMDKEDHNMRIEFDDLAVLKGADKSEMERNYNIYRTLKQLQINVFKQQES